MPPELDFVQKTLITIGVILLVLGLVWPLLRKMGLGHLPGDIVIERENFRLYFPITTMLLVSLVLNLVIWLFRR